MSAGVSATLGRIALLAAPVLGACERPAVGPRGAEPPAVAPSPPATRPASPPSVLVDAATARLLERVRSLPVRGGLAYWGLVPPAECSPVGASEVALRFGCTTGLDALEAYFEYYFPMVPVRRRPGGLTIGGSPGEATAHAVAPGAGPHAVRILVHPPAGGPRDPRAESLRDRLRAAP